MDRASIARLFGWRFELRSAARQSFGSFAFSLPGEFFGRESSPDATSVSATILQQERVRILIELDNLAAECRKTSEAKISVALEDGPVPDALERYAIRNHVDLIVISSHGRGGITRLSLGSVTDSLIRHTPVPVLVIKPHASYLSPGADEIFMRIIVPLDGSSLAEQILPEVVALAKLDNARLTLLTVLIPQASSQRAIADQRAPLWDKDIVGAQAYLYRIAAQLREQGCLTTTHIEVGENIPAGNWRLRPQRPSGSRRDRDPWAWRNCARAPRKRCGCSDKNGHDVDAGVPAGSRCGGASGQHAAASRRNSRYRLSLLPPDCNRCGDQGRFVVDQSRRPDSSRLTGILARHVLVLPIPRQEHADRLSRACPQCCHGMRNQHSQRRNPQ